MHKTTILIVDDDSDMRKMLRIALDNGKRTINETDTALGGLQLARRDLPDILLLDIGLPGNFDGFALRRAMNLDSALRHVKTVIISGYDQQENIDQANRVGVDAYLVKPFSISTLVELVERFDMQLRDMVVINENADIPAAAAYGGCPS